MSVYNAPTKLPEESLFTPTNTFVLKHGLLFLSAVHQKTCTVQSSCQKGFDLFWCVKVGIGPYNLLVGDWGSGQAPSSSAKLLFTSLNVLAWSAGLITRSAVVCKVGGLKWTLWTLIHHVRRTQIKCAALVQTENLKLRQQCSPGEE